QCRVEAGCCSELAHSPRLACLVLPGTPRKLCSAEPIPTSGMPEVWLGCRALPGISMASHETAPFRAFHCETDIWLILNRSWVRVYQPGLSMRPIRLSFGVSI